MSYQRPRCCSLCWRLPSSTTPPLEQEALSFSFLLGCCSTYQSRHWLLLEEFTRTGKPPWLLWRRLLLLVDHGGRKISRKTRIIIISAKICQGNHAGRRRKEKKKRKCCCFAFVADAAVVEAQKESRQVATTTRRRGREVGREGEERREREGMYLYTSL